MKNLGAWMVGVVCLALACANVNADVIVDNGKVGTSYTGKWQVSAGTLPYGTNSLWSRNGATYSWAMSAQPKGIYEVFMWWSGASSRPADAVVNIEHYNDTSLVHVNQKINAGMWSSLGEYYFDGSGKTTITAAAGGTISTCADAVSYKLLTTTTAPTAVIDSISPSPAVPGETVTFSGHGIDGEGMLAAFSWESSIDGVIGDKQIFSTNTLSAGVHNIRFYAQDMDGVWSLGATSVLAVGEVPAEIIIDNRDAATSRTGTWGVSGSPDFYGIDSVWSRDGATFTWYFDCPRTGQYTFSMWWTQWASRSTSIPVDIATAAGSSRVIINQQVNGGKWNELGVYNFNAGVRYAIKITSQRNPTSTCADAVKFAYIPQNQPPTAIIDSIIPEVAEPNQQIVFSGSGSDTDGVISVYQWASDIDGNLSSEASFVKVLSQGQHTISLKVMDDDGAWSGVATKLIVVGNIQPAATIVSITPNPAELDANVMFVGSGHDPDGQVTAYQWSSDAHGVLSNENSFSMAAGPLGHGEYVITFKVQDNKGAWSGPVTRKLYVGNARPTAFIDSILPESAVVGQSISFVGHGEDIDGQVTGYEWISDIDGIIGSAASFSSTALSLGTHTISLIATDNDGDDSVAVSRHVVIDDKPIIEIIDNSTASTSFMGLWQASGSVGFYGTNSLWSRDGATYSWIFRPTVTASFNVSMWWTMWSSRSPSIPVDIQHQGGTNRVYINQQLNGGKWNSLGDYSFQAGNTYIVKITAQAGPTSTCADAVKFEKISKPTKPIADFRADKTSGGAPLAIQFTDGSLGIVTSWLWNFGDNTTSTERNVLHTYTQPGTYTVSLTVANAAGAASALKQDYIHVAASGEKIYICDVYSWNSRQSMEFLEMLSSIGATMDYDGSWVYRDLAKNMNYTMYFVRDPEGMERALKEPHSHIIVGGHSNFGFGATFASAAEFQEQQILDIRYVDDDRFTKFSSDMVSVKIDGMKYGQAYPNWEPILKDGSSALMAYNFSEGVPPYNYYLTYSPPGDANVYKVELSNGSYLERFPDSATPVWYSQDGSKPNPNLNPEYFIVNSDPDWNRFETVGTWAMAKAGGGGYMGEAGYLGYNYQYHAPGTGINKAQWNVVINYPGVYAVMASWFPDPSNATNAKFKINHAFGQEVVTVDQRLAALVHLLGGYFFDKGSYTVELTDEADARVVADAIVLNPMANPQMVVQAEFNANVKSGAGPLTVQFQDLSLYYNLSNVMALMSWHWDFGDGTFSNLQNPMHTYAEPGLYTVKLKYTDPCGLADEEIKEQFIAVDAAGELKCEFTASNRLASDRTVVSFYDQSSGPVASRQWQFGDGTTSTEQDPIHVYSLPGTYNVTLTVYDQNGTDMSHVETGFVNNLIGVIFTDNTFIEKPHYYSRVKGTPITFGKVICNTTSTKIPENELRFDRMFFGTCNSANYYIGAFHRGIVYCTTGDLEHYTGVQYLENYLKGVSDDENVYRLNLIQPVHEVINFNLKPPSMRTKLK